MAYFVELAAEDNPDIHSLIRFVLAVEAFMRDVVYGELLTTEEREQTAPPLFLEMEPELRVVWEYLPFHFEQLRAQIPKISSEQIAAHGLIGMPQRFKLRTLASVEQARTRARSVWVWIQRMLKQIDTILDSLIDAVGYSTGVAAGGVVKEVKESMRALMA
ncbi:MAG TPA: hypothetical protein VKZ52_11700 [Burkholderiaceae bacterium]|nr:hypothetical protein [Burkholderiaceae bacterium]